MNSAQKEILGLITPALALSTLFHPFQTIYPTPLLTVANASGRVTMELLLLLLAASKALVQSNTCTSAGRLPSSSSTSTIYSTTGDSVGVWDRVCQCHPWNRATMRPLYRFAEVRA